MNFNNSKRYIVRLQQHEAAFTLVELLSVVVIILVLMALTIAGVNRAREASNGSRCMANLKRLSTALHLYVAEHGGSFSPAGRLSEATGCWVLTTPPGRLFPYNESFLALYLGAEGGENREGSMAFICPSDRGSQDLTTGVKNVWNSYGYNAAYLGGFFSDFNAPPSRLSEVQRPGQTVLFVEQTSGCGWGPYPPSYSNKWPAWRDVQRWDHNSGMNVAFVDGHVEFRRRGDEDLNAPDNRLWDLE